MKLNFCMALICGICVNRFYTFNSFSLQYFKYFIFKYSVSKLFHSISLRYIFNSIDQLWIYVQSQPVFVGYYTKSWPSITPVSVGSHTQLSSKLTDWCYKYIYTNPYSIKLVLRWAPTTHGKTGPQNKLYLQMEQA